MENLQRYNEWLIGFKCLIYKKKIMKQAQLAETGVATEQHINAILKGRRNAGPALQDAIARALGTSYDEMRSLGREELGLSPLPRHGANASGTQSGVSNGADSEGTLKKLHPTDSLSTTCKNAYFSLGLRWLLKNRRAHTLFFLSFKARILPTRILALAYGFEGTEDEQTKIARYFNLSYKNFIRFAELLFFGYDGDDAMELMLNMEKDPPPASNMEADHSPTPNMVAGHGTMPNMETEKGKVETDAGNDNYDKIFDVTFKIIKKEWAKKYGRDSISALAFMARFMEHCPELALPEEFPQNLTSSQEPLEMIVEDMDEDVFMKYWNDFFFSARMQ